MARKTPPSPIYFLPAFLSLLSLGIFLLGSIFYKVNLAQAEPLADLQSLRLLTSGLPLPVPDEQPTAFFNGKSIKAPKLLSFNNLGQPVLGSLTPSQKRIEVDLTGQKVYAYEGDQKIYEFLVSTGKWAPTPTGTFAIWAKVRSQLMSGGKKEWGTYYYLPNVPFVMFFYNNEVPKMRGFSLHGTYWHNNFGHPMSHGCVNMRISDAETLYNWTDPPVTNPKAWSTLATDDNPGTKIIIYGEAPKE